MRRLFLTLLTLIILGVGGYYVYKNFFQEPNVAKTAGEAEEEKKVKKEEVNPDDNPVVEQQVPTDKVWNFSFDEALDPSTVNNENIRVADGNGKRISVTTNLVNSNKTIQIAPPEEGYKKGEDYTLNIKNNISYENGSPVSKPYDMRFITERDEVEEGKLSENVIKVGEEDIQSSSGNTLVINKDVKKDLKKEDIIIVPSEKNEYGKALKITTIESSGNSYTVNVTQPHFEELFEKLNIYKSYPITMDNVEVAEGVEGVNIQSVAEVDPETMLASSSAPTHNGEYALPTITPTASKDGINLEISGLTIPLDKKGNLEADVEGSVALMSPKVDLDVDVGFGKLKRVMFLNKTHTEQDLTVTFPGISGEFKKEMKKKEFKKQLMKKKMQIGTIKVPIPAIPGLIIEGNIFLEVRAGYDGEPEVNVFVEFDEDKGVLYEDKKATPIFKVKPDADIALKGTASGEAAFGPTAQLQLSAFEVVGAGVEGFVGAKVSGEVIGEASSKEDLNACLNGSVGITGDASAYVDAISLLSGTNNRLVEFTLFEHDFLKSKLDTCMKYEGIKTDKDNISLKSGSSIDLEALLYGYDMTKSEDFEEKISNHKKLSVSSTNSGVVAIAKRKNGITVKASNKPSQKDTKLIIKYTKEGSILEDDHTYKVEIPITILDYKEQEESLNGTYQSHIGMLSISNDTGKQFNFHIKITGAGIPAEMEGVATKSGSSASFTDPDYGCQVNFAIDSESITTSEQNMECLNWHGAGTTTDGTYSKVGDNPDAKLEEREDTSVYREDY